MSRPSLHHAFSSFIIQRECSDEMAHLPSVELRVNRGAYTYCLYAASELFLGGSGVI